MKKIFLLFCFLLPTFSFANISVSPFYLEFDADSNKRMGQVRFTNNSTEEKTYNIKITNFQQDNMGKYSPVDENTEGILLAEDYLEWSPHRVTLKPNESQVIRVQRRGMATVADGEYVSHLLIQEQAKNIEKNYESENDGSLVINLQALYEVSIPVMIENGDLECNAKIKKIKLDKNSKSPKLSVVVEREGDRSFYGTLVVKQGKEEIGRINKFRIFTTTETRNIDVPLTQVPNGEVSVVLMDEKKNEVLETKLI